MGQITSEQSAKFVKMADEKRMELNEYIARFSQDTIFRMVKKISDLTEEEANIWIEKYYK